MTSRTATGALFAALIGVAGLISEVPMRAQHLQKVPGAAPLAGTEWMLIESRGQLVAQNGWPPHFKLKMLGRYHDGSTGRVEGVADSCGNNLVGTYRVTANRLRFEIDNVAASLRTCLVPKGDTPGGIGTLLEGSPQFRIHGAELDMLDDSGKVRARWIAANGE